MGQKQTRFTREVTPLKNTWSKERVYDPFLTKMKEIHLENRDANGKADCPFECQI